jgi:hypothetical protein
MTITGQNFTLRRGEDRTIQFVIEGGAGLTAASWYTSANRSSTTQDLVLESGDGITLNDAGPDCNVFVTISKTRSEGLPLGWRYHELWGVDATSNDRHLAEGGMVVEDSLRTIPE